MSNDLTYQKQEQAAASAALAKGHSDTANLRELLIWTTSKTTCATVEAYFQKHHHDKELLKELFSIALEGEDTGDAPWAAANTIADFPTPMLAPHKAELVELSKQQWEYLNKPALKALAKIETVAT
jgi:hypothetical protein